MDFDLSEEQRLLKESLDRVIADRYAFEQRKGYAQGPEGWSRELWAQFAELGLLGLPFADEYGGSSGGPVETMIAMEAFGRALPCESKAQHGFGFLVAHRRRPTRGIPRTHSSGSAGRARAVPLAHAAKPMR